MMLVRSWPAHVAAERDVDLEGELVHLGGPAARDQRLGADDDAIEIDEEIEREDGDDEQPQEKEDRVHRTEERLDHGRRVGEALAQGGAVAAEELGPGPGHVDVEARPEPAFERVVERAEPRGELARRVSELIDDEGNGEEPDADEATEEPDHDQRRRRRPRGTRQDSSLSTIGIERVRDQEGDEERDEDAAKDVDEHAASANPPKTRAFRTLEEGATAVTRRRGAPRGSGAGADTRSGPSRLGFARASPLPSSRPAPRA